MRADLAALVDELRAMDPLDAQERYVATFDRGRATSLHLFEHVHGESRDRGQAMVDLKSMYERAGLALAGNELPDYLPAVLEFLSLQPFEVAEAMLDDCAHIVRKIGDALASRGSSYAAVFAAVLAVVDLPGLAGKAEAVAEKPMDEEWAEEPVVFGPAAGAACGAPMPAHPSSSSFRARAKPADRPRIHTMDSYLNTFLFGIYPYIALAVFLVGSLIRFDREQYTWKSDCSQLLRRGQLRLGSNLFHIGILGIFGGHLVGLLTPLGIWHALGVEARTSRCSRSSPAASSA